MAKLFDSMAQLKFVEKNGQPTDEATGMYSKDGEYVDFDKPCVCVGQVYNINGVTCHVPKMVSYYLNNICVLMPRLCN